MIHSIFKMEEQEKKHLEDGELHVTACYIVCKTALTQTGSIQTSSLI